jgi:hypothetical protein
MPYDLFEHRHRFSSWAAARAAQRGWASATTKNLMDSIENSGIVNFLHKDDAISTDEAMFKKQHKIWCRSIINFLNSRGVSKVTYGRVAKLVAVYLKSMVIIGPYANSSLASVAHPPIDRILLRNLSNAPEIENNLRERCRLLNFTELDEQSYYDIVIELRGCLNPDEPFWSLERYWTVTND